MGSGYFTSLARSLFPPLIPETAAQQNEFTTLSRRWQSGSDKPSDRVGEQTAALMAWPLTMSSPADESLRLQQALSETGRDKLLTRSWQPCVRHRITPEALDAAVTFFRQHL